MARICACGLDKAKGIRYCMECWLARQPISVQVSAAEERLYSIPQEFWVLRVPREEWPAGRRWCSGCQSFVRLKDCPSSGSRCRACTSNAAHARMVERTYGISEKDFQILWAAQGGRCFICQQQIHSKRPAVDHDHDTGAVRGLLCPDKERGCNYAVVGNIKGKTLDDKLAMIERLRIYFINPPAEVLNGIPPEFR